MSKYLLDVQNRAAERIGPIGARIKGLTYSRHDNANFTYTSQRYNRLREVVDELKVCSREIIHG